MPVNNSLKEDFAKSNKRVIQREGLAYLEKRLEWNTFKIFRSETITFVLELDIMKKVHWSGMFLDMPCS